MTGIDITPHAWAASAFTSPDKRLPGASSKPTDDAPPPEAVFAFNDLVARGAYLNPSLATVRQPIYEQGATANGPGCAEVTIIKRCALCHVMP